MSVLIVTGIAFVFMAFEIVFFLANNPSIIVYLAHNKWLIYWIGSDISLCILGILLLKHKSRKVLTVAILLATLMEILYFADSIMNKSLNYTQIIYLCSLLLLLLLSMEIIPVKKLWFLPGTIQLLSRCINIADQLRTGGSISLSYLFIFAMIVALFGYGYCLKENIIS